MENGLEAYVQGDTVLGRLVAARRSAGHECADRQAPDDIEPAANLDLSSALRLVCTAEMRH